MNDRYLRLVRLVSDHAGDRFRAAFRYDGSSWDALYVRSDLATDGLQDVLPALADRARGYDPLVRESDYAQLGPHRASISLHDEAVLIHFDEGEERGVVVTLDSEVAQNLSEFVARCEGVLSE